MSDDVKLGYIGLGNQGAFGRITFEILELQLHLLDQPFTAVGTRPKALVPHLRYHKLKMLDQGVGT